MTKLLTSAEAAELLSAGTSSVKRWADSGELACVKTAGGHRRFLETEVLRFRDRLNAEPDTESLAQWIELLLSDAGTHAIEGRLLEERGRLGAWWRVADRLGEVIFELGRRWQVGALAVIDEHVCSERLHRALARISDSLPLADRLAPTMLLAMAGDDEHTLGLSLAELSAREAGYRTLWAGRGTPLEDVLETIASGRVQVLGVSASVYSGEKRELARLAQRLGEACVEHGVMLILGGSGAWPEHPKLALRVPDLEELHAVLTGPRSGPK